MVIHSIYKTTHGLEARKYGILVAALVQLCFWRRIRDEIAMKELIQWRGMKYHPEKTTPYSPLCAHNHVIKYTEEGRTNRSGNSQTRNPALYIRAENDRKYQF